MGITGEPVNNRFLQAEQANVACYLQAEQARPHLLFTGGTGEAAAGRAEPVPHCAIGRIGPDKTTNLQCGTSAGRPRASLALSLAL